MFRMCFNVLVHIYYLPLMQNSTGLFVVGRLGVINYALKHLVVGYPTFRAVDADREPILSIHHIVNILPVVEAATGCD